MVLQAVFLQIIFRAGVEGVSHSIKAEDIAQAVDFVARHGTTDRVRQEGHDVRLMPAQYVKPHVKTNKMTSSMPKPSPKRWAERKMRFVPIKCDDQLDMQSLRRLCGMGAKIERQRIAAAL